MLYTTIRKGATPDAFVEKLSSFCLKPVLQARGFHQCDFCQEPSDGLLKMRRGDAKLALGLAEIRVFGTGDLVYAAPDLIYHYVVDHHYYPPEEFIQAVMNSPLPDSPEYHGRASRYPWAK